MMVSNVVHLPRPREERPAIRSLGLYFRIGRDQHKDMLALLAEGERNFFGLVIDAPYAGRHRELCAEAHKHGLDVILDPKTAAMATVGGHTATLAGLGWGLDRHHRVEDFAGDKGRELAQRIAEFGVENGFTQILGPTHLLRSPNDQWLRADIRIMGLVRDALDGGRPEMLLIYPLAVPMQVLRDPVERRAIVTALADAPCDAVWLRIENFGSDATGEKTTAYIEACNDFAALGVPLIADHVGGVPGLGLLAYGAVGGLSHGITLYEGFKVGHWRRPRKETPGGGAPGTRVYIPELDVLMKRQDAQAFLTSSTRVRTQFGCRDTHCCPHGIRDMLNRPAGHFVHQRSQQVERLWSTPLSVRVNRYLDDYVRPVSDNVAAASGLGAIDEGLRKKLMEKQRAMSRYRKAMSHLAKMNPVKEAAAPPPTRAARERDQ